MRQETLVTNGVSEPTKITTVNYSLAGSAFRVLGWTDYKGNTASNLISSPLPMVAKLGEGANLFTAKLLIKDNSINDADVVLGPQSGLVISFSHMVIDGQGTH